MNLSLGFSPCPNDTAIFYAMAEKRIPTEPFHYSTQLADVEVLNRKAGGAELDVTKVSMHAVLHLLKDYALLRCGGAIGRGCGPLIVSRRKMSAGDLHDSIVAIPGRNTTAGLLLALTGLHGGPAVEMRFDRIMPAVSGGVCHAGVIIHEGRFTYESMGLHLVLDLGAWWEEETGLPLPLGGILIRRSLGPEIAAAIEGQIRQSLLFSREHPRQAWDYIRTHAQEMEPDVIHRHIEMFVNDFTMDMGEEGERSVMHLLDAAARIENSPLPPFPMFATSDHPLQRESSPT